MAAGTQTPRVTPLLAPLRKELFLSRLLLGQPFLLALLNLIHRGFQKRR